MNIKLLLSVILSCLPWGMLLADQKEDVKMQINKIKKSTQYIYAESTASSEEEARNYAEEKLYEEINAWVATQKRIKKSSNLVVNNTKELWSTLSMPRGNNMFRFFIYLKKSDIIPTDNVVIISNTNLPPVEETIHASIPEAIKTIAPLTEYADMAAKIKELKTEEKIKSYSRYASLNNPEKCYLVIYNREGKIVAILTPGIKRRNIKNNKADGIENYSGCGAIGIEL
ncbi:hypothetical protein H8784_13315 [Parabacteroides acidifaciens]|uniref:Uncharacterized protein n=1 Tax=Parabacteroides acidifaciens TaxID=2290935 RepID=A0A3D8HCK0_9BACT|nr:hypothetical protein [Parabacteroides acidifaciens]RDU48611.1 hypothetical protein DWU89_13675 [Parabacteroides acidifaciens]